MSKYIGEFTSFDGIDYKVEIVTNKSETPVIPVTMGGSPFVTEMDADGKTIYAPIKSQGATVEIVTGEIPFDLYSGQSLGTSVKLTNTTSNVVEWVGYLTPCAYTQGFDLERETLELECVDGLAVLKDLRYRSADKSVKSFLDIIFNCLKRAGCFKNLYVNDNIQLTASGTESIMSKLRVSESNFFDDKDYEAQSDDDVAMSCYDVLYEVMQYMGYTIIAHGDDVYILDYDALVKGRKKYFKYSLTGSSIGSPTMEKARVFDPFGHGGFDPFGHNKIDPFGQNKNDPCRRYGRGIFL